MYFWLGPAIQVQTPIWQRPGRLSITGHLSIWCMAMRLRQNLERTWSLASTDADEHASVGTWQTRKHDGSGGSFPQPQSSYYTAVSRSWCCCVQSLLVRQSAALADSDASRRGCVVPWVRCGWIARWCAWCTRSGSTLSRFQRSQDAKRFPESNGWACERSAKCRLTQPESMGDDIFSFHGSF